ncbi:hypothetical protein PsorP6_014600 [Peronosclerospora sorghi]|uniref:Uncharacterized protein n=1 Tax=Peronosclerospora sorghi TaxID=230839 RepID=A0ACC0VV46_9STRA|nr:hypothetical protein PsorP6_014600 [Peronosclerospora sorghi]
MHDLCLASEHVIVALVKLVVRVFRRAILRPSADALRMRAIDDRLFFCEPLGQGSHLGDVLLGPPKRHMRHLEQILQDSFRGTLPRPRKRCVECRPRVISKTTHGRSESGH